MAYIEPDYIMSTVNVQRGASWGLAVSSQKKKLATNNMTDYYYKAGAGQGVTVYVIDTGIEPTHPDFGGRAKMVANFVPNAQANVDDHGHGKANLFLPHEPLHLSSLVCRAQLPTSTVGQVAVGLRPVLIGITLLPHGGLLPAVPAHHFPLPCSTAQCQRVNDMQTIG